MCCAGCAAVAEAIVDAGLDDYYRLRTAPALRGADLVPEALREHLLYDQPAMQRGTVTECDDGSREAALILERIECSACAWLIERRLAALPGMTSIEVNYSTHRARARWDPERTRLSAILDEVQRIGYGAHPYDPERQDRLLDEERRRRIRRLLVAGLLAAQVMMLAAGLYLGDWMGMETRFRDLFRWASLALTIPVLLYPAQPFFSGALRGLRNRQPGMDLPVALGIGIAFSGSMWATASGNGHVYFDSVAMFTFFLLLARYLEFETRRRNAQVAESVIHATPETAWRVLGDPADGAHEVVAAAELERGDRVLVRPGDPVPADGRVEDGQSSVDESLLTGESRPLPRAPGDPVLAGSVNYDHPLIVAVERAGTETVRARIVALVERAQSQRSPQTRVADQVAGMFVLGVVGLAALSALGWWWIEPARWLEVTVAVLVVTCPCALSLATPVAHAVAVASLARHGLIATRPSAVESLGHARRAVFDKTGTLTTGRPWLREVRTLGAIDRHDCLLLAAALERHSEHPLARALRDAAPGQPLPPVEALANHPGAGLHGIVGERRLALGNAAFVGAHCAAPLPPIEGLEAADTLVLLADEHCWLCAFALADQLRADAAALIAALGSHGIEVALYSGDGDPAVASVASALGIDDAVARLAPADKLARLRATARPGESVLAIGDGINDAPVLAGADVSVAMGAGAALAQASADLILVSDRLSDLARGISIARRAHRVVRQNLGWAVAYNLLAIPAAVAGWVPPWLAALGMSLSSLAVVGNSLRIRGAGR